VSPVVGVMLMLVVTIIIAAVVSAFAGGLGKTTDKAPTLAMDVTIKNTGYASSSYILFDIQAVSDPIPTSDVKIATSWTAANGERGGNTTAAGLNYPNTVVGSTDKQYQSPLGFGRGVTVVGTRQKTSAPYDAGQMFGNYTLTPGTTMKNSPAYTGNWSASDCNGYGCEGTTLTPYIYNGWTGYADGMQAILGGNWNATRPGDIVTVKVIHIPSGKAIFNKNVVVTG
jgi:FlaG/FlaF family flagellin (archaellin)